MHELTPRTCWLRRARRQILLMPLGTWGDVLPFVQLGRELARRGHGVTLAACEVFAPLAEREGFEFRPLLDRCQYERIWADPQLWHPRMASITFIREAVLPFMRRQYDIASTAIAAGRCDLLVAPAQSLGADRRGEARRPLGDDTFGPVFVPQRDQDAPRIRRLAARVAADGVQAGDVSLRRFLRRPGLRADGEPAPRRVGAAEGEARLLGMVELARTDHCELFPDWYAEPQADWPSQSVLTGFLPVDWEVSPPLADEVDRFLDPGRRRSCLQPARPWRTASILRRVGQGGAALGRRAILLSQYLHQMPTDLTTDVLAVDFVPLAKVLRAWRRLSIMAASAPRPKLWPRACRNCQCR